MRITEKEKNGFYELKMGKEIYGEENGIRLVQIVGRYEDIEEEFGIGLITLFKALTDGIWYEKEGHSLHTSMCFNVDKEWVIGCWFNKYECVYCRLKDYKKTWALTKEGLL